MKLKFEKGFCFGNFRLLVNLHTNADLCWQFLNESPKKKMNDESLRIVVNELDNALIQHGNYLGINTALF